MWGFLSPIFTFLKVCSGFSPKHRILFTKGFKAYYFFSWTFFFPPKVIKNNSCKTCPHMQPSPSVWNHVTSLALLADPSKHLHVFFSWFQGFGIWSGWGNYIHCFKFCSFSIPKTWKINSFMSLMNFLSSSLFTVAASILLQKYKSLTVKKSFSPPMLSLYFLSFGPFLTFYFSPFSQFSSLWLSGLYAF